MEIGQFIKCGTLVFSKTFEKVKNTVRKNGVTHKISSIINRNYGCINRIDYGSFEGNFFIEVLHSYSTITGEIVFIIGSDTERMFKDVFQAINMVWDSGNSIYKCYGGKSENENLLISINGEIGYIGIEALTEISNFAQVELSKKLISNLLFEKNFEGTTKMKGLILNTMIELLDVVEKSIKVKETVYRRDNEGGNKVNIVDELSIEAYDSSTLDRFYDPILDLKTMEKLITAKVDKSK